MSKVIKTSSGESYKIVQRVSEDGAHPYEEIEPVNNLGAKFGLDGEASIPKDLIARAEAAVRALSQQYPALVQSEIERARVAAATLAAAKSPESARQAAGKVFELAHDLKGQGGSYGYPLVSSIAASLCELSQKAKTFDAQLSEAVNVHINAIALVIKKMIKNPEDAEGKRLVLQVETLTAHLTGPAAK